MTRKLGDMLRDIRNPNLSNQRLEEIVRDANEFSDRASKVQAWTRFTDSNPWFETLRARTGEFEVSPVDGVLFYRPDVQTVNDNTTTDVQFTSWTGDNNTFKLLSSSRIGVNSKHYIVGVFGTVQWATSGAGRRGVGLAAYNSAGTQVYGVTLNSLLPTGIAADTQPFAGGITIVDFLDVASIGFNVVQTSGGALDMSFFRAHLLVLK